MVLGSCLKGYKAGWVDLPDCDGGGDELKFAGALAYLLNPVQVCLEEGNVIKKSAWIAVCVIRKRDDEAAADESVG